MKVTKEATQYSSHHPHHLSLDSSPYAFVISRPESKRVNLRPNAEKPFTVALSTVEVSRRNKNSQSPRGSRTNSRSKMERNLSETSSRGLIPTNLNKNKMLKSIKSNPRYAQLLFKKLQFPEGLTETEVKSSFILQNLNSPQEEFRLPQNSQHMRDYFATTPQGLNYWNQQIREKERKSIQASTKRGNRSHFSSLESESSQNQLHHESQLTQPSPTHLNSSVTNLSPGRFISSNRVQTAYSHTNRTMNTTYKPPMTAAPDQHKRGTLGNIQLPSVIPEKIGKKGRGRTGSVQKQNESARERVKIPRDLPLSSSPLRNSYQIVRDTLMTNMFKHTAFNPAMLTNHHKKVLEGVIDPENPALGSGRRNSTVSRATSAQSIVKSPRRTKSPLRTTLLASVGAHEKKIGVKKRKEEQDATDEQPKRRKVHARTESMPEVDKKQKLFDISENCLKDPEKQTLNEIIVKHGEFVKKHSPYSKPRSMIFTPERPPLVRKPIVQKNEPPAQSHLDRIILSQFGQNQDNSNLRQIYNSKSSSINDFINYRLKRFQPVNVSTRTQVRVAKELKGDGTQMRKVPPKFKGVLDKDQASKQAQKPPSRHHSPLPQNKTPVDLRKIEKFLHKRIEPPKNVISLSDNTQAFHHLKGKGKEAMNTTLPILFEERHEPSQHDSIFNISMESKPKQGKMSLRTYNIEKRKEKMEREAKQKKINDQKKALYEQHKKRILDQAFKDEDQGVKSNSKTVFSKRSLLSSKKTSEHGAIQSEIVTTPIMSPIPPPGAVHVEVRRISELKKEKKSKKKRNPINDLMQLIKQKTESSSPRFIKELIQKRNKVSRACREMTQAITNFLDNIQVSAEEYDADEDNLHEMMDDVHITNNLDSSMKFGESLKMAKSEANETTIFVNKFGTALKNQWKPKKMKINQETLRLRSVDEARRNLELRPSQVTSAKKSPNVMVPALLDEKMRVMEQGFKIS